MINNAGNKKENKTLSQVCT